MTVDLVFPVEWEQLFEMDEDSDIDPFDVFAGEEWNTWVSDNPRARYIGAVGTPFNTTDHHTPGYEGERLVCLRYQFEIIDAFAQPSRLWVRKELRISVPAPTKLPLP